MNDWREYRPAIWAAMLGVAVIVIVSPHYLGAFVVGGAIGIAIRVRQRQRARQRQAAAQGSRGSRGRGSGGARVAGAHWRGLIWRGLIWRGLTCRGRAERRPWETAIPVISTAAPTG